MVRKEIDLYLPLIRNFGMYYYGIFEVPYYGKRVDLVLTTRRFKSIHAFEMKVYNWRVALKQAAINQLFAQRSYVVLNLSTAKRLNKSELDMFNRLGVGLIGGSRDSIQLILKAKEYVYFYREHYKIIKDVLLKIIEKKENNYLEDVLNGGFRTRKRTTKFLPIRNYEGKILI